MILKPLRISQSNSSARACACGWNFFTCQSLDVHTNYQCCKYKLIWSYNEWFIGLLVLANQIKAHAHARADGQFWPHRSIQCLHLYQRHKYQAHPLKNNEITVQWNIPKIKYVCTRARACTCRPAILTIQIDWGPQYLSTIQIWMNLNKE